MLAVFSSDFVGYIWWEDKTSDAGWIVLIFFPFFNFGKLYLDIASKTLGSFDFGTAEYVPGSGFFLSFFLLLLFCSHQTLQHPHQDFTWSDLSEVPKAPPFGTYDLAPPSHSMLYLLMNMAFYGLLTW